MKRLSVLFFCLCLVLAVGGCGDDESPRGAVATVNGKPVTLGDVEFMYDLRHMDAADEENPAVERLRDEYGRIAAGLIVRELIFQELTKAGAEVSDAELKEAEDKVRADYPQGAFEQMLVEENIDQGQWREALRSRLALRKFENLLLKDKVGIDVQEAAAYYKEHRDEFRTPAKIAFALIQGHDADSAKKTLDGLGQSPEKTVSGYVESDDGVSVQKVVLRQEALPPAWIKILEKLNPGQASKPFAEDGQTRVLILLDRLPAKSPDAAEAYPLVEERLKEKKLRQVFSDWLENALKTSAIKVSSRLLPEGGENAASAGGPVMDDFGSRLPLAAEGVVNPVEIDQVRKTVAEKMNEEQREEEAAPDGEDQANKSATPAPDAADAADAADRTQTPSSGAGANGALSEQDEALPETAALEVPNAPEKQPAIPNAETAASGDRPADVPSAAENAAAGEKAAPDAAAAQSAASGTDVAPTTSGNVAAAENAPAADGKPASDVPAATSPEQAPDQTAGQNPAQGPGEVTFTANKASWIILFADDGKEERVYLKNGKSLVVPFKQSLKVRFGSPCDVTYAYKGRETQIVASTKEVKTAAFP